MSVVLDIIATIPKTSSTRAPTFLESVSVALEKRFPGSTRKKHEAGRMKPKNVAEKPPVSSNTIPRSSVATPMSRLARKIAVETMRWRSQPISWPSWIGDIQESGERITSTTSLSDAGDAVHLSQGESYFLIAPRDTHIHTSTVGHAFMEGGVTFDVV